MADHWLSKITATLGTTLYGGSATIGMQSGPAIYYGSGKWWHQPVLNAGGWSVLADPGTPGEASIELHDDYYLAMCPDLTEPLQVTYTSSIHPQSSCAIALLYGYCSDIVMTTADGVVTYGWDADAELDEWFSLSYPTLSGSQISADKTPLTMLWAVPNRATFLCTEGRDGTLWMVVGKHSRILLGAARPYVWGGAVYPDVLLYRREPRDTTWSLVGTIVSGASLGSAVYRPNVGTTIVPLVSIRYIAELPDGRLRCAVALYKQSTISVWTPAGAAFLEPDTWWFVSSDNGVTWSEETCAGTDGVCLLSAMQDADSTYHMITKAQPADYDNYRLARGDLSAMAFPSGALYVDIGYKDAVNRFPGMSGDECQLYPDGRVEYAVAAKELDRRTETNVTVDALRVNANIAALYESASDTWHALCYYNSVGYQDKLYYYPAARIDAQTKTYNEITALAVAYGLAYECSVCKASRGQAQLIATSDGTIRLLHHEYTLNEITEHESHDGGRTWSELSALVL